MTDKLKPCNSNMTILLPACIFNYWKRSDIRYSDYYLKAITSDLTQAKYSFVASDSIEFSYEDREILKCEFYK